MKVDLELEDHVSVWDFNEWHEFRSRRCHEDHLDLVLRPEWLLEVRHYWLNFIAVECLVAVDIVQVNDCLENGVHAVLADQQLHLLAVSIKVRNAWEVTNYSCVIEACWVERTIKYGGNKVSSNMHSDVCERVICFQLVAKHTEVKAQLGIGADANGFEIFARHYLVLQVSHKHILRPFENRIYVAATWQEIFDQVIFVSVD